jgi:hypothetical protein
MEAKRRTLDGLATRQREADEKRTREAEQKQAIEDAHQLLSPFRKKAG